MNPLIAPNLIAHHVGCLTHDLDAGIADYKNMGFKNISEAFDITSQHVRVCFIEIREGFYIELVECSSENTSLQKILRSSNPYYHIGYTTRDISITISQLEGSGFHLVTRFDSEAFDGKACAFLYSPDMKLIELIQE